MAILEAKTLAKKMDDLKRLRKFAKNIKTTKLLGWPNHEAKTKPPQP